MKGINRIIDALVSNGRSNKVSIDSDSLLESLAKSDYKPASKRWWEIHYQKGLRLILVLSAIIMMLSVFLYYCFRYINDVFLFENQITINDQGAFTSRKSLNCEYANYLFNTTDLWANSGIQVNEKDRIRINISGGFNARISEVIDAAKDNKYPDFPWVSYDANRIEQSSKVPIDYCISRGDRPKDYRFGSALYAIAPESLDLQQEPIGLSKEKRNTLLSRPFYKLKSLFNELINHRNWNGSMYLWKAQENRLFRLFFPDSRDFHQAGRTGTLFFAVNDVYIQNMDTLKKYYNTLEESYTKEQIKNLSERPKHTYENNFGQLLVSVEIQRHVPYKFFYPTMAYRFLEYHINETLDSVYINYDKFDFRWYSYFRYMNWIIKQLICCFWFIVFCLWVTLLFGLYMIALLAAIYLLFVTGRLVSSKLDKTYHKIKSIIPKNDA